MKYANQPLLAMSYHVTVTNCRSFLPRGSPNLPSSVYSSFSSWLWRSHFTFDVKTSSFLIKTVQIWMTELYAKPLRHQQGQYNNVQYNVLELVSVCVQRICKACNNYTRKTFRIWSCGIFADVLVARRSDLRSARERCFRAFKQN